MHRVLRFVWLFLVLAWVSGFETGCTRRSNPPANSQQEGTTAVATEVFAIEGMTCEVCASRVTSALKALPGVESVEVSLKDKKATVVGDSAPVPAEAVENAVSKAGYKAHLITGDSQSASGI